MSASLSKWVAAAEASAINALAEPLWDKSMRHQHPTIAATWGHFSHPIRVECAIYFNHHDGPYAAVWNLHLRAHESSEPTICESPEALTAALDALAAAVPS